MAGRYYVIPLTLTVMLLSALSLSARRVKSRPGDAQRQVQPDAGCAVYEVDTICGDAVGGAVVISGYDKPLRSSRETMFVTNNDTLSTIVRLVLTLDYTDDFGQQLHRRSQSVTAQIPPCQTRIISIPAWDTQQTFYYRGSNPPKRARAYRYDVKISTDTIFSRYAENE